MKIATVSLSQIWEDKKANFKRCKKFVKIAKEQKANLIIFPEMTLTGFSNNISKIAESYKKSWSIKKFKKLAKKNKMAIIFGVVLKKKNKGKNSLVFVDKNGKILNIYTKIHPFSFANEDKYFKAGKKIVKADFKNIKIGLSICYDLRFCNLYSKMDDCEMVVNIANWPQKRVEHWKTLLKARAIENQTYIIGVNRIGKDGNNLEYLESSKIFNANGEELEYKKIDKEMKIYNIDLNWNKKFKESFNTIKDKRNL
jgi:predicted amidohydrolase